MKKLFSILTGLLCLIQTMEAQNEVDALRYSGQYYLGNARSIGMGSAMGAVGGNSLSPVINPAGLGIYRNSEFSGSLGLDFSSTNSDYNGYSTPNSRISAHLSDLNLTLTDVQFKLGKPVQEGWASYTFSMGFNRRNSFSRRTTVENPEANTSYAQSFAELLGGTDTSQIGFNNLPGLAYYTFLIDPADGSSNTYVPAFETDELSVNQNFLIEERGAMNDNYAAFGANYSNKFYVGAMIAVPTFSYRRNTEASEINSSSESIYLNSGYNESIRANGVGFKAGVGFLVRPIPLLRFGASIYTPTFYRVNEEYTYTMRTSFTDVGNLSEESDFNEFRYNITTPFRATASAAFLFNKYGLISIDYEYTDFSSASLSSNSYSFSQENRNINQLYTSVNSIRVGTEWNFDALYLRGGFGFSTSPYNSGLVDEAGDGSVRTYSFGLGYRHEEFFVDAAYQLMNRRETYVPYVMEDDQPVTYITDNRSVLRVTFGLIF